MADRDRGDRAWAPRPAVPLAPLTTFGVGGQARWLAVATSDDDLADAHRWSRERGLPLLVLGGGSNVIVSDDGFDGLVVQMAIPGTAFTADGDDTLVTVGAGEHWDRFVATVVARGLAGVECLSGIPGTVGGTPIQNVGAYGQDVASVIERVSVFDRSTGRGEILAARECGFSYRMSRFKREDVDRFVVTGVTFRLRPGDANATYPDLVRYLERAAIAAPTIADIRSAVLDIRRSKGMVVDAADPDTRSVGSFFMNPVVSADVREHAASVAGMPCPAFAVDPGHVKIPAAWLIERAGFTKGYADGRVGISSKHPLALVNRGGASAREVLHLARHIKSRVADVFGVSLRPEPVFVGYASDPDLEFLQNAEA